MEKDFMTSLRDIDLAFARVLNNRFAKLGLDITPVQSRIIVCIFEHDNLMCQKDLEVLVSRNKSTLSSILDNLEKRGYVIRCEGKSDSRKKMLTLTDKSLQVIKTLNKDKEVINDLVSKGIKEDEYNTFCGVLKKIKNNLEGMK